MVAAAGVAIFSSIFGIAAAAFGFAASAFGIAATHNSMSEVIVGSSSIPGTIPNSTIVRLGVGLNNTVLRDKPLKDAQGDLPTLVAFNENKEIIGYSRVHFEERIGSGSFVDIRIEHEEWAINQQATHLQVIAGDDGICVAYLMLTMADSTQRGWLGDMGRACGYDWGYSNILVGESGYKPTCTWIEKAHARGVYAAGLQIDMNTFTRQNEGPPGTLEYFCNSSRMLFMDEPDYSFRKDTTYGNPLTFSYWQGQKKPRPVPKPSGQTVTKARQKRPLPIPKPSSPTVTKAPENQLPYRYWAWRYKRPTATKIVQKDAHPTSPPKLLRRQRRTNQLGGINNNTIPSDSKNKSNSDPSLHRNPNVASYLASGYPPPPNWFSGFPIVRVSHPQHSAKFACQSEWYKGASIISPREGLFCDGRAKTLYPLCGCEGVLQKEPEGQLLDIKVALQVGICFDEGVVALRRRISVADALRAIPPVGQIETESFEDEDEEMARVMGLGGVSRGEDLGSKRKRDEDVSGELMHAWQVATTDSHPGGERFQFERFPGHIEAWDENLFTDEVDLQTRPEDCKWHHRR